MMGKIQKVGKKGRVLVEGEEVRWEGAGSDVWFGTPHARREEGGRQGWKSRGSKERGKTDLYP